MPPEETQDRTGTRAGEPRLGIVQPSQYPMGLSDLRPPGVGAARVVVVNA